MRIKRMQLERFRRFTDLTIDEIPEEAKLVVLVGPNGCGKSSIFDALSFWFTRGFSHQIGGSENKPYFLKQFVPSSTIHQTLPVEPKVTVNFWNNENPRRDRFYYRTAYRNTPDFSVGTFTNPGNGTMRGSRSIDEDQIVQYNYQKLYYMLVHKLLGKEDDDIPKGKLKKEFFRKIQNSINSVFSDLCLNNFADSTPINNPRGGTFFFKKGNVSEYDYKNLSGGEKSVFDLLLDLHMAKEDFGDTIYCIDEIESHVHTSTQRKLLRELINIIPEDGQLWLATHSLGVLREAQILSRKKRNFVCIIDFDEKDLDSTCTITPSDLEEIASRKFFSVALDGLEKMILPDFIVVCEGSADGKDNKDFDKEIYETIFKKTYPEVFFISGGSKSQAIRASKDAERAVKAIKRSSSNIEKVLSQSIAIMPLIDRDSMHEEEEEEKIRIKNEMLVLPRRNIESCLFDEEILKRLIKKHKGDEEKTLSETRKIIKDEECGENLKKVSHLLHAALEKSLKIERGGSDTTQFMKRTLAPLTTEETEIYKELEERIIKPLKAKRSKE